MRYPSLPHRAAIAAAAAAVGLALAAISGCAQPTPPPIVEAPQYPGDNYVPHQAPPKPLPESAEQGPGTASAAPYQDAPIIDQPLPDEQYFVSAYDKVQQPRIVIYVNRTLSGQVIPVNPGGPMRTVQRTEQATGAVNVGNGQYREQEDAYGREVEANHSRFQSNGPASFTESTTTYLPPGQYDEADVKALDYDAMEKILDDWISCQGQVHIISSDFLQAQLGPAGIQALSQGQPQVMDDLAKKVGADVLIQVQAHPTRQANGLAVRVVAEAMNVRGGDQIGQAVVDIPLPLEKTTLNRYTRFLANKLTQQMAQSWNAYAANPPPPPPAVKPAPPAPRAAPTSRPVEQLQMIP